MIEKESNIHGQTEKKYTKLEDLGSFMNKHGANIPNDILIEFLVSANYKRAVYKGMRREPELEKWHEAILSLESSSQGLIKQTTLAVINASLTMRRLLWKAQLNEERGINISSYEEEKLKRLWRGYLITVGDLRSLPEVVDQEYEIPLLGPERIRFLVNATRQNS